MSLGAARSGPDSGRIAAVMRRRVMILALLVYVALDLSIPSMPGAFGVDPDDSVESLHQTRARATSEAVIPPASGGGASVLAEVPPEAGRGPASPRPAPERPRPSRRSALTDEPARPSEDPH